MAKYSKKAGDKVEKVMHEYKHGQLKSGSGGKVKNRKQAIAIGLSEAREAGAKVPKKKSSTSKSTSGTKSTSGSQSTSSSGRKTGTRSKTTSRARTSKNTRSKK